MKTKAMNSAEHCPLHAFLSGVSGALPQDPAFCPDCAGPDEDPICCALALIRYLTCECRDPMGFLAECRRILDIKPTERT